MLDKKYEVKNESYIQELWDQKKAFEFKGVDNRKICPICLKRELHLILLVKCSKWSQMIKRINRMILIIR